MNETSKATERRLQNRSFWDPIFKGAILDVGAGDDPLQWDGQSVLPFDKQDGDANKIDTYFSPESFDCVHGSQVMEHLDNPADFVRRCLKLVRPGGWVVHCVPDYDLYEKRNFPSKYNGEHKGTWSLWRKTRLTNAGKGYHIHVPEWIKQFDVAHRDANLIDTNYDYLKPDDVDQTWLRGDAVECFIEILLQKKP